MRKSVCRKSLAFAFLIAGLAPSLCMAQLGAGFYAPPEALDQLSAGSTGVAGGKEGLERAQAVAGGGYYQVPGEAPTNAFAPQGFEGEGGAPNPFGEAPNPFGPQQGGFNVAAINVAPPTLRAWGGERLVCHRTGVVLQDAREIKILASAAGSYFDDGENGNDASANDNLYTNITISDEFISPEAQLIKTKLIQTLQFTSELSPMDFFQVRAATTEPQSPLPKVSDLEAERDRKLSEWLQRFLRDYRINPEDGGSEFYPTFLPPPPRAPNIPLPSNFTPKEAAGDQTGAGGAGFGAPGSVFDDRGVTGEPLGNASSRYF